MPIAREGFREITIASILLWALAVFSGWLFWPLAIPFVIIWLWVVSFFRDPQRRHVHQAGDLCSAADGTVTEIADVAHHKVVDGPAVRVGVFLSIFDVHVNRMPCSGTVRMIDYKLAEFLDARHPESGTRNEANTLLIDPDSPIPGPVQVRQVAGKVARRIVCHAKVNQHFPIGARFGMIKFGSRTEVIFPKLPGTQVLVSVGDKVRAGITVLARQPATASAGNPPTDGKAGQVLASSASGDAS